VGKVEIKTMYPLDMEEFLLAAGERDLVDSIRQCFAENSPMPKALHDAAMNFYRTYLFTGGMPDCVSKYLSTNDTTLLRHIQKLILESYLNDMSKYNTQNEIKKTHLVYDTVTVQLSRKNTRFQYKLLKKGGRAAEFENAIEWLCLSGIVTRVYRAEQPYKPIENYRDIDSFKIYVSDTGLLCAKKDIMWQDIFYAAPELEDFRGGMTENYAASQLIARGYVPYYWTSDRSAEVDFMIQKDGDIIPVEVKSSDNTKAKSLDVYIQTYKPKYAVKLSARNFGFADGKKTVPLYAAFCL
jgi:predicted AAA+ superfamily ATPase